MPCCPQKLIGPKIGQYVSVPGAPIWAVFEVSLLFDVVLVLILAVNELFISLKLFFVKIVTSKVISQDMSKSSTKMFGLVERTYEEKNFQKVFL